MTHEEKQAFLHQLAALMQDNLGNRITHVLINGLCTTLDAVIPAQPRPAGPDESKQPGVAP